MIVVLRLGHRLGRDARISTHVGLVARAFGADSIIISGEHDKKMIESIMNVSDEWGGHFDIAYKKKWKQCISEYKKKGFSIIHLTMYGLPIQNKINKIRKKKNLLIVVGGQKVPGEVYKISDYNIAITNQPHSEVAALSVFLHEYFSGAELDRQWKDASKKIIPQKRGKQVVNQ